MNNWSEVIRSKSSRRSIFKDIGDFAATVRLFYRHSNSLITALMSIPFAHTTYVDDKNDIKDPSRYKVKTYPMYIGGGTLIHEYKDGELVEYIRPLHYDPDTGWYGPVHVRDDVAPTKARDMPYKSQLIPGSIGLSEKEAFERAKELFTGEK